MSVIARLRPLLVPAIGKHSATVIFLHGSGDTAFGIRGWLQQLNNDKDFIYPHIRTIFPSAPERPYTPLLGESTTVWFDRTHVSPDVPESATMDESAELIDQLIENEVQNHDIPRHRIILGGFSMGGALSLYYGLQRNSGLHALFGLSTFLNTESRVYETLSSRKTPGPPVFQCHGNVDPLVHHDWGKATSYKLQNHGIDTTFHTMSGMYHEMWPEEMKLLWNWIQQKLPPEQS